MPELAKMVKEEYEKIIALKEDSEKISAYIKQVNEDNRKVVGMMHEYIEKHNLKSMSYELSECIRDTIHCEAIVASGGDFSNIEIYVVASRNCVQKTYLAIFNPKVDYDPDQAIAYIMSPNTHEEHEDQEEIMKWYRLLADHQSSGTDNENEQLQKGRSKRKNNSG